MFTNKISTISLEKADQLIFKTFAQLNAELIRKDQLSYDDSAKIVATHFSNSGKKNSKTDNKMKRETNLDAINSKELQQNKETKDVKLTHTPYYNDSHWRRIGGKDDAIYPDDNSDILKNPEEFQHPGYPAERYF